MAEFGAPRILTTPGGVITFNTRLAAEYFITNTIGEDGVPLRTPGDSRPGLHGGHVFPRKKQARSITVEGLLTLDPALLAWQQIQQRNEMEAALIAACDSILGVEGTWEYQPTGMAAKTVTVLCDLEPSFSGPGMKEFVFGLIAGNPDWA